jgi:hypothetical protein
MKHDGEERESGREDEVFVSRVREAYRVPERSPVQNAAFDARLQERVQETRVGLPWGGVLAGAAIAAAIVFFALAGVDPGAPESNEPGSQLASGDEAPPPIAPSERTPAPRERGATPIAVLDVTTVEDDLTTLAYGHDYGEEETTDAGASETEDESLPNDYVAIANLFLDG